MSVDALDEVRRAVAAERGLDEAAAAFLHGSDLDAIESSADRFVALIGKRDTSTHGPSGDLFADVARAQAARKVALVDALVGRPIEQARDEQGRFASFDGGAREDVVPAAPQSHGDWLGEVLRSRSADLGAGF